MDSMMTDYTPDTEASPLEAVCQLFGCHRVRTATVFVLQFDGKIPYEAEVGVCAEHNRAINEAIT